MAAPDELARRGADDHRDDDGPRMLTSGDVARLFGVDPKTVARWADAGRLDSMRTLGGHRRYRAEDVRALLDRSAHDHGDVHADPRSGTRPGSGESADRRDDPPMSSRPAAG